ncbi:MAG: cob(I)yrinic acid a,c-diamide adenosyltransferase [Clostridiales bacterium]|nr:cob(I)yrinic acid a,c-diamide adenosyltransferase [Clostridiales bacterium]
MKIYTRGGDKGETSLFGGQRVSKTSPRVEAYGAVDELNAWLGICAAYLKAEDEWHRRLLEVQGDLFQMGALLATPPHREKPPARGLDEEDILKLESWIDEAMEEAGELKTFILPGGSPEAAFLHGARTVCRRAEREVVRLAGEEPVPLVVLAYLNRLSDWLFALARAVNRRRGVADVPWVGAPRKGENP